MDYPATGPAISLVAKSVWPRHQRAAAMVARAAGLDGIELDGSGWLSDVFGSHSNAAPGAPDIDVTALWLPRTPDGPFHGWRQDRLVAAVHLLTEAAAPPRVVADRPLPNRGPLGNARQAAASPAFFTRLWSALPDNVRMTIALRPRQLAGGRDHLTEIAALRRFAEEWDLDVALDLSGPVDPRWEAEAAILRLMPRLQVIRFGPLTRGQWHGTEPRLATRVLSCAADLGYTGRISISAGVSGLSRWRMDKMVDATTLMVEIVRSRFDLGSQYDRDAADRQRFFSH